MLSRRLRKEEGEGAGSAPGTTTDEAQRDPDRALLCRGCKHVVGHEDDALEIAERHQHTCVNPAGIVFRIRCFARAPGVVGHGEVTDFYSWFAGYAWQVALCEKCAMHLGWVFTGPTPAFFGLIADRIVVGRA